VVIFTVVIVVVVFTVVIEREPSLSSSKGSLHLVGEREVDAVGDEDGDAAGGDGVEQAARSGGVALLRTRRQSWPWCHHRKRSEG